MEKSLTIRKIILESKLNGKPLRFVHPARGPGSYVNVAKEISEEGLVLPRGPETASLVGAAFDSLNNRYSKEIKQIMDRRWFWIFTRNLYIPRTGVYLYDEIDELNESELIHRLGAGDKSVRLVPFGFKIGKQKCLEFAKNDFIVALFGEEGAEKLAKASEKYRVNPSVSALPEGDVKERIIQTVSGLDANPYCGNRLNVCTYSNDTVPNGRAFALLK